MYTALTQHAITAPVLPINKTQRIGRELDEVGVTMYGRAKFACRLLPQIIHDNEHIGGAVYGRYSTGDNLLKWNEGMLIATNKRIIFLDHKPGFEALDELTYDVVSGMQKVYAWPFTSFTLHTRICNYSLRYVNQKCVDAFMHYVENRRLEGNENKKVGG